jgi:hypothetical protein
MTEKSSWVSKVRGNTQLLIFTGSEPPRCPKCGHRDYEPAENHPNEMSKICVFLHEYGTRINGVSGAMTREKQFPNDLNDELLSKDVLSNYPKNIFEITLKK